MVQINNYYSDRIDLVYDALIYNNADLKSVMDANVGDAMDKQLEAARKKGQISGMADVKLPSDVREWMTA